MKLTLTKVYRSDKDKEGKPLVGKFGPYTKLAVKANEFGEKWLSGFSKPWNEKWNEGDVVEAEVEEKGEYLNLKEADPLKALTARVLALEEAVYKSKLPTVSHDDFLE